MRSDSDPMQSKPARRSLQPMPLPPVNNSLDFPVEAPERPEVLLLFLENFKPNNKLVFAGKFHNLWTAKFRSDFGGEGQPSLVDEAQLSGPVGGADARLRLKPEAVSVHLDLGHHLLSHKTFIQSGERVSASSFWNPYLAFQADRRLKGAALGLGVMFHSDNYYKDNFRLTLRSGEVPGPSAELSTNTLVKQRGLSAAILTRLHLANSSVQFAERRMIFGLERAGYQFGAEAELAPGSFRDWVVRTARVACALDFREQGVLGAMLAWQKGSQTPRPSLCYRNRFSPNLELKTRLDFKGNTALYANLRIKDGLNLHCSVQTRGAGAGETSPLFGLPFDLGLKLKFDR